MSDAAEILEQAVAIVRRRAVVRSYDLARDLGMSRAEVEELLMSTVEAGELIACKVESPEYGAALEYRLAMVGGGTLKTTSYHSEPSKKRPPTPLTPEQLAPLGTATIAIESSYGTEDGKTGRSATQRISIPLTKGMLMTNTDKIKAAFEKHGPMTTRQLGKRVDVPFISVFVSQHAKPGGPFVKLGGKKFSYIYGLPGQKLPKGDGVDIDAVHATTRTKSGKTKGKKAPGSKRRGVKAARKRAQVLARVQARLAAKAAAEAAARAAPGSFRPAITNDGAILLTGAAKAGELNRGEARELTEFLLRVNDTGARA
jgi:hypothetical protein